MTSFTHQFEELPDFWEGDFRSGSHNGSAEIEVLSDGGFVVKSISLDCHNGKCGPLADSKMIEISRTYQAAMFEALSDSIDHFLGADILYRIEEMRAEAA